LVGYRGHDGRALATSRRVSDYRRYALYGVYGYVGPSPHVQPGERGDQLYLADREQLATVIPRAERANGPVDVLINNAGLQAATPLAHVDPGRLHDVIVTNVVAPLELCRQALQTTLPRRSGVPVNVTSLAGEFALRNIIPYCSSKAALTTATSVADGIERGRAVMVLPPIAAPVHHFRLLPTGLVDAIMVGIPRTYR
jgi:NAD(P)-dependent dehydrogenase (short-subunit alcohol dehydrogenase family)